MQTRLLRGLIYDNTRALIDQELCLQDNARALIDQGFIVTMSRSFASIFIFEIILVNNKQIISFLL